MRKQTEQHCAEARGHYEVFMEWMEQVSWSQNDRSGPAFLWARPPLSHGCLSSPQSSILDLADIFTPTPALPSTHCSADPWDIPGGHAGLQEPPRLAPESPFLPGHLLAPPFPQLRVAERQLPLWHGVVVRRGSTSGEPWEMISERCSCVLSPWLSCPSQSCWGRGLSCPCPGVQAPGTAY